MREASDDSGDAQINPVAQPRHIFHIRVLRAGVSPGARRRSSGGGGRRRACGLGGTS